MTDKRIEIVNSFYGTYDEDARLVKSRHGQLEYAVTMEYIHRFAEKGCRILEVGAGTGRYSVALAGEGYAVTAVELVESNLAVLRQNGSGLKNLCALQGDATDLSRFADGAFDVTLVLGPLYHLYQPADVQKAIDEAIRVTRPGGVLFFAFLPIYAVMASNYLTGGWQAGEELNFTPDYRVRHFAEQLFTGYDVAEFEALFADKDVDPIATVGTDWLLEPMEGRPDFAFSDEAFDRFTRWYLAVCEKRELLGSTNHLLYLCRRR